MRTLLIALMLLGAQTSASGAAPTEVSTIKGAIERGLDVVTRGAAKYPKQRECFSCHHQTLPLMAMMLAGQADYKIDTNVVKQQIGFTQAFFARRKESLDKGERIGGAAATLGYGLWTYDIVQAEPDDVTDTLVASLIKLQEADGRWRPPSHRPPLEESQIACTVLAGYGLQTFGRGDQKEAADKAFTQATKWLLDAKPESNEDHASLLLWFTCFQPNADRAAKTCKSIMELQRADGGWAQMPGVESDAYATGQSVFALSLASDSAGFQSCQKGIEYLLTTQKADGSWHVKSRSKPVQKYFDNGDPHGKDQFISMAATSWAVAALAMHGEVKPYDNER